MEFRVALKQGSGLLQPSPIRARPQRFHSHITASLSNGKLPHHNKGIEPIMPSIFARAWNGWLRWPLSKSMLVRARLHHECNLSTFNAVETALRAQDAIWGKESAGQPNVLSHAWHPNSLQVLGCAGVREGLLKDKWAMITGKSSTSLLSLRRSELPALGPQLAH